MINFINSKVIALEITFVLLLTFPILGIVSQNLVGPDPAEAAVMVGTTVTLECSRAPGGEAGPISWFEEIEGGLPVQLYFRDEKLSNLPEYDNFDMSSDGTDRFDLIINNIAVEDEGIYYCQHGGTGETGYGTTTVEVRSTDLIMRQDGADVDTVTVLAGNASDITCTASGARPAVTIEWHHRIGTGQEIQITTGVTEDPPTDNGDGTFDTISALSYDISKEYNGGRLRCVTTGQQVAESREDTAVLNVQYNPVVSLTYGGELVTCSSDANPSVEDSGFEIFVNGSSDKYRSDGSCADGSCTLELPIDADTEVRCDATNAVGTGTKTITAVPGATTPEPTTTPKPTKPGGGDGGPSIGGIVGGVMSAVIGITVTIIIVIVVMKKKKDSDANDPSLTIRNPQSNPTAAEKTYTELDKRTREGQGVYQDPQFATYEDIGEGSTAMYQEPAVTESAAAQPYMELDQRTRERQGVYQDPQSVTYEDIDEDSKPGDDEYQEPYQELGQPAKDKSASEAYVNVPQVKRGRNGNR